MWRYIMEIKVNEKICIVKIIAMPKLHKRYFANRD